MFEPRNPITISLSRSHKTPYWQSLLPRSTLPWRIIFPNMSRMLALLKFSRHIQSLYVRAFCSPLHILHSRYTILLPIKAWCVLRGLKKEVRHIQCEQRTFPRIRLASNDFSIRVWRQKHEQNEKHSRTHLKRAFRMCGEFSVGGKEIESQGRSPRLLRRELAAAGSGSALRWDWEDEALGRRTSCSAALNVLRRPSRLLLLHGMSTL